VEEDNLKEKSCKYFKRGKRVVVEEKRPDDEEPTRKRARINPIAEKMRTLIFCRLPD
jgi:hypothetical protein